MLIGRTEALLPQLLSAKDHKRRLGGRRSTLAEASNFLLSSSPGLPGWSSRPARALSPLLQERRSYDQTVDDVLIEMHALGRSHGALLSYPHEWAKRAKHSVYPRSMVGPPQHYIIPTLSLSVRLATSGCQHVWWMLN